MKEKLRLLLFPDCNRNCAGCCNKQWDLTTIPICHDYSPYRMIMLTGGEPMLKPDIVREALTEIYMKNPKASRILYTAETNGLDDIMQLLHGVTVTLHSPSDIDAFLEFDRTAKNLNGKSLRLNVFAEVYTDSAQTHLSDMKLCHDWKIKDDMHWIENCPLPENEVFMKYEKQQS